MPVTAEERTYLGPDIPVCPPRHGLYPVQRHGLPRASPVTHELVIINRELRELSFCRGNAGAADRGARRSQGMTSLREAALQLVREGETTPEELLKITFYEE